MLYFPRPKIIMLRLFWPILSFGIYGLISFFTMPFVTASERELTCNFW
jgi:hypothetical protein